MLPSVMKNTPAVFAVKNEYQIMIPVNTATVMWVRVGEQTFFDDSNGILRSDTDLHRIVIPMSVLDAAGSYTVCWREIIKRRPYFSKLEEEQSMTFAFRPVGNAPIRAYMISDAHGMLEAPVGAAKKFAETYGKIDLLILNGDILDHSDDMANFMLYYQIAEALTGGEIPVIISRGNHDLRGRCAEKLVSYMPGENGNSFYSFRVGSLWGILLDCGEDKADDNAEYGGTICCHAFRARETKYLQSVVANAKEEYCAPGVEHRIVISHVPFTEILPQPFDIEREVYGEWVKLLSDHIKPELLLSGHMHWSYITRPGEQKDAHGMNFPTVVGSEVRTNDRYFAGCGILLEKDQTRIVINNEREILRDIVI